MNQKPAVAVLVLVDFDKVIAAAEEMAERDSLEISVSSLRRVLIEEGLWKGKRRAREYRARRERRECFGGLIPF